MRGFHVFFFFCIDLRSITSASNPMWSEETIFQPHTDITRRSLTYGGV
jgi:hypothetical protein